MLVEVKDNLVVAFRAANDALRLSLARSAKAWFRRATAFEKMRDYRNAVLDLEEALLREPQDKAIVKKRNEMRDLASHVAENMYYARHKDGALRMQYWGELDLSENPLGAAGAKELAKLFSSDEHKLRVLRLQETCFAAFSRQMAPNRLPIGSGCLLEACRQA
eukprot:g1615.t1